MQEKSSPAWLLDRPQPETETEVGVPPSATPPLAPPASRPTWLRLVVTPSLMTPEIANFAYPGGGTVEDPYVVSWLPGTRDPRNPKNFSPGRRWLITILAATSCFAISYTSSAYTGGIDGIMSEFGVSSSLAQAGVSLFVLGFAVGPLVWAPLGEIYGRQPIFVLTFGLLVVFNALGAWAHTFAELLVFRTLAGIVGSSPLTNAGGLIADMFEPSHRGLALGLFSFGPYMGPVMGPIVGGYLGASSGGWRSVLWLSTGLCGVLWLACTALTPETFAPVLLARRAAHLSRATGKVYVSQIQQGEPETSALSALWTGLSRPWDLLLREPIVLIISVYMAIVYATMYMLFAAYPIIFRQERGWSAGQSGLAFIAMAIGLVLALSYMVYENERYKVRAARSPGGRAQPEDRLPVCMAGGVLVPIGLFLFAWTNAPSVHWSVCLLGTLIFGVGNVLLYLSAINYLVDSYVIYTASCMAGSSVLRSLLGAAFPLFTKQMYNKLGIHWASSVPAFLALACVPFPFLFARYGARIRAHCYYSAKAQAIMEKMENARNANE